MNHRKDIPLKIEIFSDGDDSRFAIHSKREIHSILRGIAHEGARVALYYGEENDFILTTLLEVDDHGLWVEAGAIAADNQRIQRSDKIVFISSHRQVKVQFVAHHIRSALHNNAAAFLLPLPDKLLRIQRRDYFRLTTPVNNPLRCIIPVARTDTAATKREVTIMDISVGGVALVCEEYDTELLPGNIYPGCRIALPDIGAITATVQVKTAFEITRRNAVVNKRVGCEFIDLTGDAATLLQRYVTHLQGRSIAKG